MSVCAPIFQCYRQSQPPGASRRSISSLSREPTCRMSKTPLFLPPPTGSSGLPPGEDWNPDKMDIISITSSSDSPPPPPAPRRSPRKPKKERRQLMAHVLIPTLPPGSRKSDYVPVEKWFRTRKQQTAAGAKGKARAGDNSGSRDLAQALQGAFDTSCPISGSAHAGPKEKEKLEKEKSRILTPLDQALTVAFTHNSANPRVASGSTRRLTRETRAETLSDRVSVGVVVPSPRRKREHHFHRSTSLRRIRRHVARAGDPSDEREQTDSDDGV